MIDIRDLQFAYEDDGFRLQVDTLSISAGQRVAWTGPSGSGKTTLLHLVAGIIPTSTGRVQSCGHELSAMDDSARRDFRVQNVGLVFQEFELLEYLSVLDNILLAYRINRSIRLTFDVRMRAYELATELGLGEFLNRHPTHLSQGERQRVAVCRALITNPRLLLADEPTANLDQDNATLVLDALDRHVEQAGATLVVVTHDQNLVSRFDRQMDVAAFAAASSATATQTPAGGPADAR